MLLNVIILLYSCVAHVTGEFHCEGTCYSGTSPKDKDITKGKHLKGHSYKNITTDVPQNCFSSCINDCRCKAFQMKNVRCELLEEDKTSKADDFVLESGYVYYDMQQEFHKESSHLVQPGLCENGCCKYQPCLNGGTCTEHCHTPKEKFTCKCSTKHYGKVCEKNIYNSCMDVLKTSAPGTTPVNGVYSITQISKSATRSIYCAFVGDQAWSLFESFSLANIHIFKRVSFYQPSFGRNAQKVSPVWAEYRLRLSWLKYLRTNATMFRATCDFPNRASLTPDFLLGYLSEYDIINHGDVNGACVKFAHINVRGHNFYNTTASVWHKTNAFHVHLECGGEACEFSVPDPTLSEDCFGYYDAPNPNSTCTATPQSTTQWWLGEQK